jgi:hypothetical protein
MAGDAGRNLREERLSDSRLRADVGVNRRPGRRLQLLRRKLERLPTGAEL